MTTITPGGGFPHAAEPYDPTKLRTYSYSGGATKMGPYRIAKDIVIAAGTAVDVDPVGTNVRYESEHASVKIEVSPDATAEWAMDLQEALDNGVIEAVPEGEAA